MEILDFEFWIEYVLNWRYWILDFGFGSTKWILAAIEFWYWAAANSYCHLKKKMAHTGFPLQPCWYVLVFVIFAQSEPFSNAVSEEPRWCVILSITVVQPCLYLQYFLSRLDNRACKPYTTAIKCVFSTSEWISTFFSKTNFNHY